MISDDDQFTFDHHGGDALATREAFNLRDQLRKHFQIYLLIHDPIAIQIVQERV